MKNASVKRSVALVLIVVCLLGVIGTAMAATYTLHPGDSWVVRTYPDGRKMVVSYTPNGTAYDGVNTYINGYLHFV